MPHHLSFARSWEHDCDWEPPIGYEGEPLCRVTFVVSYTGDDPGGVESWTICGHRPDLELTLGGATPFGMTLPSSGPCQPHDGEQWFWPDPAPGGVPIEVVSETTTACTVEVVLAPNNVGNSPGILLYANAVTARGDRESLNTIIHAPYAAKTTACGDWEVVKDLGTVAESPFLDCDAASRRWSVASITDVGPFAAGDPPSSAGKMITIVTRGCLNRTPPDYYTASLISDPLFRQRQWESGDACCPDEPTSQEDWDDAPYEPGPFGAPLDYRGGGLVLGSVRPPRDGRRWDMARSTPLIRKRWPVVDALGETDLTATLADPDHGSKILGYHEVFEVFLGDVSNYLWSTPTVDWDTVASDGTSVLPLQLAALIGPPNVNHSWGGPGEIDVWTEMSAGGANPITTAQPVASTPVVTSQGCTTCCGCPPPEGSSTFSQYRYALTDTRGFITCTDIWPEDPEPALDNYNASTSPEFRRTASIEHEYAVYELIEEPLTCGEAIGFVPDGVLEGVSYAYTNKTGIGWNESSAPAAAAVTGTEDNTVDVSVFTSGNGAFETYTAIRGYDECRYHLPLNTSRGLACPTSSDPPAVCSDPYEATGTGHSYVGANPRSAQDVNDIVARSFSPNAAGCLPPPDLSSPCGDLGTLTFVARNAEPLADCLEVLGVPPGEAYTVNVTEAVTSEPAGTVTAYGGAATVSFWEYAPSAGPDDWCRCGDPLIVGDEMLKECSELQLAEIEWPLQRNGYGYTGLELFKPKALVPASWLGSPPTTVRGFTGRKQGVGHYGDPYELGPEPVLSPTIGLRAISRCFACAVNTVGEYMSFEPWTEGSPCPS
jgi:hypothetical protein